MGKEGCEMRYCLTGYTVTTQQYRGPVTEEERGNGISEQQRSLYSREGKTQAVKRSHKQHRVAGGSGDTKMPCLKRQRGTR